MSRDYSKLIGRIIEKFRTRNAFAQAMGISERTLSLKLNSKTEWRQTDIEKACKLLGIAVNEMTQYFFVR